MPLPGIGVAPPAGSLYTELTAATRRAFVPRLFVQIYFASPSLFYLTGNAQRAAGGLNQITVPMQGQSMVQGQFTGYGGGFNSPNVTPGVQNGQWNLAYWVVPVPLPFGESVLQATDREISLLKARMNDVYAVTRQNMARLLYTNNSSNSLFPNSFLDAFDSGANFPNYGGISRNAAGNSAFKGQYINMASANYSTVSTSGFTRATMATLLANITDSAGGEAPTYGVMNPGDFATLNKDFVTNETAFVDPGGNYSMDTSRRTSFPNLNVSGIPIFADHFVPQGQAFFPNVKYTAMYLSEDAAFDFSGFYSLVPLGQIGQQGVVVVGYNLVSAKSSSGAIAYNIGNNSF
ncbi:MAG: hypothetical protein WA820_20135 [Bradyrhizobium sp.]